MGGCSPEWPSRNDPVERLSDSQRHLGWYDRGYLPHFDAPRYGQAITFRLADSMPKHVLDALEKELAGVPEAERNAEEVRRFNRLLDGGSGSCALRQPWAATIVQDSLLFGHALRYDLLAWAVMPNHVHVLIRPEEGWTLGRIVGDWKKHTARKINRELGRTGRFWFREYFDRFQRDPGHRERTVAYIERNPVKAGLCVETSDWRWSSGRFRDDNGVVDWDRIVATVGRPGSHSGEWRSREVA